MCQCPDPQGKHHTFVCPSDKECNNWLHIVCCLNKELFDTKDLVYNSKGSQPADDFIIQKNDIYDTSSEARTGQKKKLIISQSL